ncbi:MAG: hypothetical protein ABL921_23365 [Pirellula sp.]
MSNPEDSRIESSRSWDGASRWTMPYRELGNGRHFGWLGIVILVFGSFSLSGFILGPLKMLQQPGLGGAVFALPVVIALVFLTVSCFMIYQLVRVAFISISVACNRTRTSVSVNSNEIAIEEQFFFYKLKRRCKISNIKSLRIQDIQRLKSVGTSAGTLPEAVSVGIPIPFELRQSLVAILDTGKAFLIAVAYPADLLEQLQVRIAEDIGRLSSNESERLIDRSENDASQLDPSASELTVPLELPEGSRLQISRRDDGITIESPALGIFKGSKGLAGIALMWNGFMAMMIIFMVATWFNNPKGIEGPVYPIAIVIAVFLAIGIGLAVTSINMGRRTVAIATSDGTMFASTKSIFGTNVRNWEHGEIQKIVVGPSGSSINDIPLMELHIHSASGARFGMLGQLSNDELEWVAHELRQSLGIEHKETTARLPHPPNGMTLGSLFYRSTADSPSTIRAIDSPVKSS